MRFLLWVTGVVVVAWLVLCFVVGVAVPAAWADPSIATAIGTVLTVDIPKPIVGVCTLENGNKKRCVEYRPLATASPAPTATAKPTAVPLPCEDIGGKKDYTVGQERMLCFDAGAARTFMEVSVVSMPSCGGDLQVQLQAPSGARYDAIASQPNSILPWEPGRWYLYTRNLWGNCSPFVFTPR